MPKIELGLFVEKWKAQAQNNDEKDWTTRRQLAKRQILQDLLKRQDMMPQDIGSQDMAPQGQVMVPRDSGSMDARVPEKISAARAGFGGRRSSRGCAAKPSEFRGDFLTIVVVYLWMSGTRGSAKTRCWGLISVFFFFWPESAREAIWHEVPGIPLPNHQSKPSPNPGILNALLAALVKPNST